MKRIEIIILFLLAGAVTLNAQESKFYEKYGDEEGVTSVYMPLGWLSQTGVLSNLSAEVNDDVDLSPIINKLTLLVVLNTENPTYISKLASEVKGMLKDKTYQMIFQVRDDGETIAGYVHTKDKKNADELVLFVDEKEEVSLIQFFGDMTMDDIKKVASSVDL